MRRIALTLATVVLFLLSFRPLQSQDWSHVFETIYLDSIMRVHTDMSFCTGVTVDKNEFLTAAHCLQGGVTSGILIDALGVVRTFYLESKDEDFDLAILESIAPHKKPIELANVSPAIGTPVLALGFTSTGNYPKSIASHVHGYTLTSLTVDHTFQRGFSGGPLVNLKGQMVGINVATNQYVGYSVPIETVKLFLKLFHAGLYK